MDDTAGYGYGFDADQTPFQDVLTGRFGYSCVLELMKQEADALSADVPDGDGSEKMLGMVLLNLINFLL